VAQDTGQPKSGSDRVNNGQAIPLAHEIGVKINNFERVHTSPFLFLSVKTYAKSEFTFYNQTLVVLSKNKT
jgi:hypothetical protein